jgi:hypothetical protein
MPYICLARTDVPDGTVQILDLKPNTSNRNLIYEPPGQTRYVNRAVNETPVAIPTSGAVAEDVNGLRAYIADRYDPTNLGGSVWSHADLETAADTLLARVDAGEEMTDAAVNTALTTALGAAVTSGTGGSDPVLTELLSVLSGRGYVLPAGEVKLAGGAWSAGQAGSFTEDVLHFGTTWDSGEIVPAAVGGDTVAVETKPIRHTYDSTHFQVSLGAGHLATFQAGVTLFPDSDLVDHYPWLMQGANDFPQADDARVVTVYNDDGTLA